MLEEAGIDWNTIYDAQANGTWTWAMFEDMLKTITRDTDNDGVNDIYGIIGSGDDMYVCATFANGGCFFDFDENGQIYPAMNSDATISALSWGKEIQANYWAPTPEGANWDWYKDAWKQGYCGFYMYQTYGGGSRATADSICIRPTADSTTTPKWLTWPMSGAALRSPCRTRAIPTSPS